MKLLVSSSSLNSLLLDLCLVLCFVALIGSPRQCDARTLLDDDESVKPVHEVIQESGEPKSSGVVDVTVDDQAKVEVSRAEGLKRDVVQGEGFRKTVPKEDKASVKKPIGRVKRDSGDKIVFPDDSVRSVHQINHQNGAVSDDSVRSVVVDDNVHQTGAVSDDAFRSVVVDENSQVKKVEVEGIRRLDVNVEEDDKKESLSEVLKSHGQPVVPVQVHQPVEVQPVVVINNVDSESAEKSQIQLSTDVVGDERISEKTVPVNIPANGNFKHATPVLHTTHEMPEKMMANDQENPKLGDSLKVDMMKLESLKNQALAIQKKISDYEFLQNLKKSEILPEFPKITENQFFDLLKIIMNKKGTPLETGEIDIKPFESLNLDKKQIEMIKFAGQLIEPKERPSFSENLFMCISKLDLLNCMRIFIYPMIVDNLPEAFTQQLPTLPIEINVADLWPGKRPKSGKQVPIFSLYMSPQDPDTIISNILLDGLSKMPSNEKTFLSYIAARNETLSKLLSCSKMNLLITTEKFLPENMRLGYSDQMISCVRRFEYFSCLKFFSWPEMKKYYSNLPEFPLSDSYLSSLTYANYPLITYPGFPNLPEIIESGSPKLRPETVILNLLQKTLNSYSRFTPQLAPVRINYVNFVKSQTLTPEQIETINLSSQLMPIHLRADFIFKTTRCMQQYGYYNCMKYVSWPAVRQFNPRLPQFPNIEELLQNFQFPDIPALQDFFNQFPQFQLPFDLPQFPDFSNIFPRPPGTENITTPSPPTIPDFPGAPGIPDAPQIPDAPGIPNVPGIPDAPAIPNIPEIPPFPGSDNNNNNTAEVEQRIYKILKEVRDSMGPTPLSTPSYANRKVFLFPLMTEDQSKIFALAEKIVPPLARETLITNTYFCLSEKKRFSSCAETIIWPSIQYYVKGLPEFPKNPVYMLSDAKIGANMLPASGIRDDFFMMREIEKIFIEGSERAMLFIIQSIKSTAQGFFNAQKILDILRSIQFNLPDFQNMQIMQYPKNEKLSPYLTDIQENIVHAVEDLLPEQARQKFLNDMIDCAQKKKFSMCSRFIIFPTIYPFFQSALMIPSNPNIPQIPFFQKPASADPNKLNSLPMENKITPEKPGENILLTTEKPALPIYPSNPESVIFSIFRKVQANLPSLPEFPKESIANTPEFRQMFSVRQAHILTVAENILPETFRKGLLEDMYRCNQKDSFLNCMRDIVFPVMLRAYPDFPSFPDFEKDLSRSNVISVISSLNQPSSSSRNYDAKRTFPAMDVIYRFVPDDKKRALETLVDELPDSLYYDVYLKMIQCTQYSDGISCGHDLIYPVLKQYYNVPGFDIDLYYPISTQSSFYSLNQPSNLEYELYCENMGFICTLVPFGGRNVHGAPNQPENPENSYIPFGRLSDGSRIYKHTQDVWNSNITPSVGEHSPLY